MSQPVPAGSEQPAPAEGAEPEPAADVDADPAPLNRADRRAKAAKAAKAAKGEPTHVGPRGDLVRQTRGARPHTKRSNG